MEGSENKYKDNFPWDEAPVVVLLDLLQPPLPKMLATAILASLVSFLLTLSACAYPVESSRALLRANHQRAGNHAVKTWPEHRTNPGGCLCLLSRPKIPD